MSEIYTPKSGPKGMKRIVKSELLEYIGQRVDGNDAYRGFGTNLAVCQPKLAIEISGDRVDINEALKGLNSLLGFKDKLKLVSQSA
jgi:hypothetical protein